MMIKNSGRRTTLPNLRMVLLGLFQPKLKQKIRIIIQLKDNHRSGRVALRPLTSNY